MPDDRISPKKSSASRHVDACTQRPIVARDRVLDEAEQLFRTRGYNTVTMRDIALEVGIRQASLYYHFKSKEQLFVEVTERMFERHRIGLQQAIDQNGSNLRSHLQAAGVWFLSQPPIHFLSMVHTDMPLLSEENINRLSACSYKSIFEPIHQIFAQAKAQGEIRDVRPELLAGFFLSVMESIPFVTSSPSAVSGEIMVNEMINVLLDGLKPIRNL
ncbi:TetR/AcrR family transcriptional regulator [Calothrix sp. PCC 7507]|uniref:TetR/AcrR family transcriptional regulator n=1 Tax=Calothrix sp. PCC 7507 TaxID=99598 RepID=UPI00029ED5EC|nr:TetR/AcrR family transcriptional regulator [Calothrix sp. PCC 7507]AFY33089.1 transcriptional regulator, TetR family [Calothrix sp. PCC 7507]